MWAGKSLSQSREEHLRVALVSPDARASSFSGFPGGSEGKESACDVGDLGLIPGLGRSPGEGKVYPLQ